jgi:hypothetical protein
MSRPAQQLLLWLRSCATQLRLTRCAAQNVFGAEADAIQGSGWWSQTDAGNMNMVDDEKQKKTAAGFVPQYDTALGGGTRKLDFGSMFGELIAPLCCLKGTAFCNVWPNVPMCSQLRDTSCSRGAQSCCTCVSP